MPQPLDLPTCGSPPAIYPRSLAVIAGNYDTTQCHRLLISPPTPVKVDSIRDYLLLSGMMPGTTDYISQDPNKKQITHTEFLEQILIKEQFNWYMCR